MKAFLLVTLLLIAAPAARAQAPIGFDPQDLLRHRISGETELAAQRRPGPTRQLRIRVSISPDGRVVAARAEPQRPMLAFGGPVPAFRPVDPAPAVAEARRWRFRPFTFRGRPLPAWGWIARVPRARLSQAFAEGAGGCDPGFARTLVAAGADPIARTNGLRYGRPAGSTALMTAISYLPHCPDAARGPLVAALAALGVEVNAVDSLGRSALYSMRDPELLDHLLALGARADVHDAKGHSPVVTTFYEPILLRLLEAGADPRRPLPDGTLRARAARGEMQAVLAWLDAHGIE